jgi:hypothetical protein
VVDLIGGHDRCYLFSKPVRAEDIPALFSPNVLSPSLQPDLPLSAPQRAGSYDPAKPCRSEPR